MTARPPVDPVADEELRWVRTRGAVAAASDWARGVRLRPQAVWHAAGVAQAPVRSAVDGVSPPANSLDLRVAVWARSYTAAVAALDQVVAAD